jgi:cysteine desulfurase
MIYLDYAATTPLDPRVLDAMLPYLRETFGNPSSIHRYGQRAEAAVEAARDQVAELLGCSSQEIVFTSCGSESDNLALRGGAMAKSASSRRYSILTSRAEHHAVSKTAEQLAGRHGFSLEWLNVNEYGMVTSQTIEEVINENTAIVSVMFANNEIGTINPIAEISEVCHAHGALFHTDAVQAAAYLPVRVSELGVDLISLGGHKFYGPKGVGALYVRQGTKMLPHLTGGGQEHGLRAGTSNVAFIVGFAEALKLAVEERDQRTEHVRTLRDHIVGVVLEQINDSRLTGHPDLRLPNHASFAFKRADGNLLLQLLDNAGFACSSGSACKTGNPEPSEVMDAIGLSRDWGLGSLRVTLGSGTSEDGVMAFLSALPELVEKARRLNQR